MMLYLSDSKAAMNSRPRRFLDVDNTDDYDTCVGVPYGYTEYIYNVYILIPTCCRAFIIGQRQ